MSDNTITQIRWALNEWIRLITNFPCEVRGWVPDLQERLETITNDKSRTTEKLVDGNLWGGMGSFIDCALFNVFAVPPTATDPQQRAAQWQRVEQRAGDWKQQFNEATMVLGEAILSWCQSNHPMLGASEREMIERWVEFAQKENARPFQPLTPEQVATLEHNLGFYNEHLE